MLDARAEALADMNFSRYGAFVSVDAGYCKPQLPVPFLEDDVFDWDLYTSVGLWKLFPALGGIPKGKGEIKCHPRSQSEKE